MPPRPAIPADDLYATLGVPDDASPEAIEVAWRGLLRRHHPDVAGDDGLALAKRINVAHDWLGDPDLRRRYDETRRPPAPPWAGARWRGRSGTGTGPAPAPRRPRRPPTTAELVNEVVERTRHLRRDELDRLALAEPAPIAFLATLRRFVAPDLAATLDDAGRRALAGLPAAARARPAIRDAIEGQLASIVLADTLLDLLGDAAAERATERLTRGWDAAVGKPRYGPATDAVQALLADLAALDAAGLATLAATGTRDRLGPTPWPDAVSPDDDEALRVSSELAAMDATEALAGAPLGARRAAARIAHLLALRHAFPARAFQRLAGPWLGGLIPTHARRPRPVRRRT
jgi:curved DNA-binding protein CbpA